MPSDWGGIVPHFFYSSNSTILLTLILIILLTVKMIGVTMAMVVLDTAVLGEPPHNTYFVPSNEVSFAYSSWIVTFSFDLMPYRSHVKELQQGIFFNP